MIPYIFWRTIELGPITLQVWGIFVALGFAFGAAMAGWLAKRRGDDPKVVFDLVGWLVITGIVVPGVVIAGVIVPRIVIS